MRKECFKDNKFWYQTNEEKDVWFVFDENDLYEKIFQLTETNKNNQIRIGYLELKLKEYYL